MSGNARHALGVHGACAARSERGPWRGLRVAWLAPAGWATRAVSLGIHWRGCRLWLVVDALVSNGALSVGVGEREREW
jgi:hypothetical protein